MISLVLISNLERDYNFIGARRGITYKEFQFHLLLTKHQWFEIEEFMSQFVTENCVLAYYKGVYHFAGTIEYLGEFFKALKQKLMDIGSKDWVLID